MRAVEDMEALREALGCADVQVVTFTCFINEAALASSVGHGKQMYKQNDKDTNRKIKEVVELQAYVLSQLMCLNPGAGNNCRGL